jgi:gluconate 5-dehydrogenase
VDLGSRAEVRAAADKAVRHFGEPDILVNSAGATVLLAGPASAYVTGQAIFVDGGFSAH